MEELDSGTIIEQLIVGSVAVAGGTFTIGYVLWVLRSGMLLSTVLASMPTWCVFDPLPVLETFQDNPKRGDSSDESISSILSSALSADGLRGPANSPSGSNDGGVN